VAAPEYATPAEVLARLRMTDTSPDADYVALCTDAANELVANWLQRPADDPLEAPYPSSVRRGAIGVAIRVYRFRDTEANVDEGWGPEGVAVSLPRDPLAGYVDMLGPWRHGSVWSPQ
jgi:hypothetical protein